MNPYDQYFAMLDGLISLSQRFREMSSLGGADPVMNAKLTGTVRCDIGTQRGKTSYIRRSAGAGCLVIVPTRDHGRFCYGRAPAFDVCTETEYLDGYGREVGRPYHTIFVEAPDMMPGLFKGDALWRMGVRVGLVQTFVILG
ncbi:hypothetical protein [Chromobacterium vaccinii]|uniref:hypothetical protein n=1 Tax=Chromobacterium vaccinii TaxID=1108595 RepID=UPI00131A4230|nr:hypothetical protein [Chromobacterium vaccinii]